MNEPEPPFHLFLHSDEVPLAASALRLFLADEAHAPDIRQLARDVLAELDGTPDGNGTLTVTLAPAQMKITYSAVRLLLNDSQRDQVEERDVLRQILDKLPDEHTMRAIELD